MLETPNKDVFIKISDAQEKGQILSDLVPQNIEIHGKVGDPSAELMVLRPLKWDGKSLSCLVVGTSLGMAEQGDLYITFLFAGEKYFQQSHFQKEGNVLRLDSMKPLFKLQRRDDFRLRIPDKYKAHFFLKNIEANSISKNCRMLDLSAGGCRITLRQETLRLKVGDVLNGALVVPDRPSIPLVGEIRHVMTDRLYPDQLNIGIQFKDLSLQGKNRLGALVIDLYREIFLRAKDT